MRPLQDKSLKVRAESTTHGFKEAQRKNSRYQCGGNTGRMNKKIL